MTQLPNRLSATVRLALKDLKKVERSPKYEVDMGTWHEPVYQEGKEPEKCVVCFAGSVMAKTLGAEFDAILDPEDFGSDNADKLNALDILRDGQIEFALNTFYGGNALGSFIPPHGFQLEMPVSYYNPKNPAPFHKAMTKIANHLEKYGY